MKFTQSINKWINSHKNSSKCYTQDNPPRNQANSATIDQKFPQPASTQPHITETQRCRDTEIKDQPLTLSHILTIKKKRRNYKTAQASQISPAVKRAKVFRAEKTPNLFINRIEFVCGVVWCWEQVPFALCASYASYAAYTSDTWLRILQVFLRFFQFFAASDQQRHFCTVGIWTRGEFRQLSLLTK